MKKILLLLIVGFTAVAEAAVVNINVVAPVNFGAHVNTPVEVNDVAWGPQVSFIPYSGTTWNNVNGNFSNRILGDFLDSEGNPTGVTIQVVNNGGNVFPSTAFSFPGTQPGLGVRDNYLAVNNNFGQNPVQPINLIFGGLLPGELYTFAFHSQGDKVGQGGTFSANGQTSTSGGTNPFSPSLVVGINTAYLPDLVADGNGRINFLVDHSQLPGGSDDFTIINGLQIQGNIIPEPSSGLLVIMSALGIFFRRKRH